MGELTKLIARLEALTGPDREVDCALWAHSHGGRLCYADIADNDFVWEKITDDLWIRRLHKLKRVPLYTASLDAAVALAVKLLDNGAVDIEVAHRSVGGRAFGRAEICGPDVYGAATGPTPAIALILATLKALAAKEVERD